MTPIVQVKPVLHVVVHGTPKGAQRHRSFVRGGRVATHHAPDHIDAEERIRRVAAEAWAGQPPLDVAVELEVVTWHARPARLRRKKDAGDIARPYTAKPDADNVAKLVMDALTKAAIWTDDTRVADLVVRRRYLPLDSQALPIGGECVEIVVSVLP
jgi:Holliday junction resolvase RusA-like endonuclease